jgi:hypothetical protein
MLLRKAGVLGEGRVDRVQHAEGKAQAAALRGGDQW